MPGYQPRPPLNPPRGHQPQRSTTDPQGGAGRGRVATVGSTPLHHTIRTPRTEHQGSATPLRALDPRPVEHRPRDYGERSGGPRSTPCPACSRASIEASQRARRPGPRQPQAQRAHQWRANRPRRFHRAWTRWTTTAHGASATAVPLRRRLLGHPERRPDRGPGPPLGTSSRDRLVLELARSLNRRPRLSDLREHVGGHSRRSSRRRPANSRRRPAASLLAHPAPLTT